jgi:acyl-CoA reductase-like NAD-dependent aldehyde dehydrogenase
MDILNEEVFGPVAPIGKMKNEAEAIMASNNSEFWLGAASVWTSNSERELKLARQIRSGVVKINEKVRSEPGLPFGGLKHSGIGSRVIGVWYKGICQSKIGGAQGYSTPTTCGVRIEDEDHLDEKGIHCTITMIYRYWRGI